MGLLLNIYRSDYDSTANVFHGCKRVCVVNLPGPFDPTPDCPAAVLDRGPYGDKILLPDPDLYPRDCAGPMFGGTFAFTSDSRGTRTALPIHDRFETWDQYRALSI